MEGGDGLAFLGTTLWKIHPVDEALYCLARLLEGQPNPNHYEVIEVLVALIKLLRHYRMAPTVDTHSSLACVLSLYA